jgi:sugar phosphate isomerase/epimerase
MNIGVQLWSVNQECTENCVGTLKKLSELGFDGVEFAGNLGGELTPVEMKAILGDHNLVPVGIHVRFQTLCDQFSKVMEYVKDVSIESITIPVMDPEYTKDEDGYKMLGDKLNYLGQKCISEGVPLYYHNHRLETQKFGEYYGLDFILKYTRREYVNLELDVGFLAACGMDSAAFIKSRHDRIGLLHLKDPSGQEAPRFRPLGQGLLDVKAVAAASENAGIRWNIIELGPSDVPGMEGVAQGLAYLKSITGTLNK